MAAIWEDDDEEIDRRTTDEYVLLEDENGPFLLINRRDETEYVADEPAVEARLTGKDEDLGLLRAMYGSLDSGRREEVSREQLETLRMFLDTDEGFYALADAYS